MSKVHKIVVLPGDGIGPEVTEAAVKVLDACQKNVKSLKLNLGDAEKFGCMPERTDDHP